MNAGALDDDAVLELQRVAGNEAVAQLVADAPPNAGAAGPADFAAMTTFNPMDRAHRLVEAIDQNQVVPFSGQDPEHWKRHVDFAGVLNALNGLTGDQVRAVDAEYVRYEKRPLQVDLLEGGQSHHPTDLTYEQTTRIRALLGGTAAGGFDDPEAVAEHVREADAAELHGLLFSKGRELDLETLSVVQGAMDGKDVERSLGLMRQHEGDREAFVRTYERLHVTTFNRDLASLGVDGLLRATMILAGNPVAADAMKVAQLRGKLAAVDSQLADLRRDDDTTTFGLAKKMGLEQQRKSIVDEIVSRTGRAAEEGRTEADGDPRAADAAGRARVEAVVGDSGALAAEVKGAQGEAIRAIANANPAGRIAARMRGLLEDGKLTPDAVTAALRELRSAAADRARQELPYSVTDAAIRERTLADQWFADLRIAWDAGITTDKLAFDKLLERGSKDDAERNSALAAAHGALDPVSELVFALRGERKDLDTVKRVLEDKSAADMQDLRAGYLFRTGGRSLDHDLFGDAPTTAGQENPGVAGVFLFPQGKAGSGADRMLLEDYMQRPGREGDVEEVLYILGRAEREYEYTIANGGLTGKWRDAWGDEARSLLDATIRTIRSDAQNYLANAGWVPGSGRGQVMNPKWTESEAAAKLLVELRLARATIRGDREGYERATAELRSVFEMVATLVVAAALSAVIGPLAAEIVGLGELGEGAAMSVRFAKWVETTSVSIASNIGANAVVYGNNYGWSQVKRDLAGGFGGAIGTAALEKLSSAVALGMVARLGVKAPPALIKAVSETAGGTFGGQLGTGIATEGDPLSDVTFESYMVNVLQGQASSKLEGGFRKGFGTEHLGKTSRSEKRRSREEGESGPSSRGSEETAGPGGARHAAAEETPAEKVLDPAVGDEGELPTTPAEAVSMHLPGEDEAGGRGRRPDGDGEARGRRELERALAGPGEADAGRTYRGETRRGQPGGGPVPIGPEARHIAWRLEVVRREWHTLKTPQARAERMYQVIAETFANAGMPVPKVVVGDMFGGGLTPGLWRIGLNEAFFGEHVGPGDFAGTAGLIRHEFEHALQMFRIARQEAALTQSHESDVDLAKRLELPVEIIEAAREVNRSGAGEEMSPGSPAAREAAIIYHAEYSPTGKAASKKIRDDLLPAWEELRIAGHERDAAKQQSGEGSPEHLAALLKIESIRQRYAAEFAAYHNMPIEVGAYRAGDEVTQAVAEHGIAAEIYDVSIAERQAYAAYQPIADRVARRLAKGKTVKPVDQQAFDRAFALWISYWNHMRRLEHFLQYVRQTSTASR